MARLKDKVCIITGATSGIGHRSAQVFSGEGAKLVIAGRREAEGIALAEALGACDFVRTDVTIETQMQALVDFAYADTAGSTASSTTPAGRRPQVGSRPSPSTPSTKRWRFSCDR
jgi:NADP-dependent 3-hydroxy acid dehydrogenase YdfG